MSTGRILFIMLISAVIVFSLRALPFVIFNGESKMPNRIMRLGQILPSAIMAVLIIYCIKDVVIDFAGKGIFQLLAVAVVGISYKLKHNTFLSIFVGTAFYMVCMYLS